MGYSQRFCRLTKTAGFGDGLFDQGAFRGGNCGCQAHCRLFFRQCSCSTAADKNQVGRDTISLAQANSPFDHVRKLADIARPVIEQQFFQCGRRQAQFRLVQLRPQPIHEMPGQNRNVILMFTQGRNLQRNHMQPVKQIFAELAAFDQAFQIAVRRGDNPYIYRDFLLSADSADAAFLQHSQQFRLHMR